MIEWLNAFIKNRMGNAPWSDALLCTITFVIATLFTFTSLRDILQNSHGRSIVPMITMWFHPIRTYGNLIDVIYFSGVLFCLCISTCVMVSFTLYLGEYLGVSLQIRLLCILSILSTTLGYMGALKIRKMTDPFFPIASSATIFAIGAIMVGDSSIQRGKFSVEIVVMYLKVIMFFRPMESIFMTISLKIRMQIDGRE